MAGCCCALLVGLQEAAYLSVCVRESLLMNVCVGICAHVHACVLMHRCVDMCRRLSVHMLIFVHKSSFVCVCVCLCLSVLL